MSGIHFISDGAPTGYGMAGIAYVRALVHAGVPVYWQQALWGVNAMGFEPRMFDAMAGDASLADLPALIEASRRPIPFDTTIIHFTPDQWLRFLAPGRRHVGYTTFETDRFPLHWTTPMRSVDEIWVPAAFNVPAIRAIGVQTPTQVVPHIRRQQWNAVSEDMKSEFRQRLGIPHGHTIFYSINFWDVRKNVEGLMRAYVAAFRANDPVCLLLKSSATGFSPERPLHLRRPCVELFASARAQIAAELNRPEADFPAMRLIAHDALSGRDIDTIHACGDCYVTLAAGEGWGLGAFDAASVGIPVIATGWSAFLDYLSTSGEPGSTAMERPFPGAVRYAMESAALWPVNQPIYYPSMRWAKADLADAASLMQAFLSRPTAFEVGAKLTAERIQKRYDESTIGKQMLTLLGLR